MEKKIPYCTIIMVTLHLFPLLLGPISFESQMTMLYEQCYALNLPVNDSQSDFFHCWIDYCALLHVFCSFFLYFFTYSTSMADWEFCTASRGVQMVLTTLWSWSLKKNPKNIEKQLRPHFRNIFNVQIHLIFIIFQTWGFPFLSFFYSF